MSLLERGHDALSAQQIAEAEERLGAEIGAGNDADRSTVTLSALSPTSRRRSTCWPTSSSARRSRRPRSTASAAQALTGIAQAKKDPQRVGSAAACRPRSTAPRIPMARPPGGDPAAIASSAATIWSRFQQRWLRPDNAKIFVVSTCRCRDAGRARSARSELGARRRRPRASRASRRSPPRPAAPEILLVDRPGAPQSTILGGQLLPLDPRSDVVAVQHRQRGAWRAIPVAAQHGPARRPRAGPYGVSGSQSCLPNAVPTSSRRRSRPTAPRTRSPR